MASAMSATAQRIPPQVCVMALGCTSLAGLLGHWARLGVPSAASPSVAYAAVAAALASTYVLKALAAPRAVVADLSSPHSLAAAVTFIPVTLLLTCRFRSLVPEDVAQAGVRIYWPLAACMTLRFLHLNYQKGMWPDPSWFPSCLLLGFINVGSHVLGPAAVKEHMQWQFGALIAIMVALVCTVAYRLLFSKVRDSVAPNASMAILAAPCSLYSTIHSVTGKPFGDNVGLALLAGSTLFLFVTLGLLYRRRDVWARNFHVSYVALTFPSSVTATAALLASEVLPPVAGSALRAWAALLTFASACVIKYVLCRFVPHAYGMVFGKLEVAAVPTMDKPLFNPPSIAVPSGPLAQAAQGSDPAAASSKKPVARRAGRVDSPRGDGPAPAKGGSPRRAAAKSASPKSGGAKRKSR